MRERSSAFRGLPICPNSTFQYIGTSYKGPIPDVNKLGPEMRVASARDARTRRRSCAFKGFHKCWAVLDFYGEHLVLILAQKRLKPQV